MPLWQFPGFTVAPNSTNTNWGLFIADSASLSAGNPSDALADPAKGGNQNDPFDGALYFAFNSRFVAGWSGIQTQCPHALSSASPSNYMYLCSNSYDTLSSGMEFAPCLSAQGDPAVGQASNQPTPPGNGMCQGSLSAISFGVQAEDFFGQNVFTIPFLTRLNYNAYLNNGWLRVVNSTPGTANYFTWLDAWNQNSQTIRQGFWQTTHSLNPYAAVLPWDFAMIGNIYDTLGIPNPYAISNQLLNYLAVSTNLLCNSASSCTGALAYSPPGGTVATYRFTLRSDIFFHDGKQLTSFDVVFSYLSMLATGAALGAGLSTLLGITVLSPTQFDLNLNANGPYTIYGLDSIPIMPGSYWNAVGQFAWNTVVNDCVNQIKVCFTTQYSVNYRVASPQGHPIVCNTGTGLTSCGFTESFLNVDPNKIVPSYDPVARGKSVGSGPWMCVSGSGVRGMACTSSGVQNPAPSTSGYTLTRFGTGHAPGSSVTDSYFRSSGTVALWFWSGNTGDFGKDFLNFGVVAKCVNAPVGTAGCTQWQQGIGGELNGSPTIVAPIPQASIVVRFVGVDMVSVAADPVNGPNPTAPWTSTAIPMLAVGSANSFDGFPAPVLYEGSATLSPASAVGCASGYPTGGYDC